MFVFFLEVYNMRLPPILRKIFDLDIVRNNWRLSVAFLVGVILTSIVVEDAYVKSIIDNLISNNKLPEPIIISKDRWFYKTKISAKPLEYEDEQGNIIKCTSIQGTVKINQLDNSDEFTLDGTRRVCISNEANKAIRRNIGW